jgi:hypothetical protein
LASGAPVIPQQIALPRAMDAFDTDGSLKDKGQQELCKTVVEALAIAAKKFIGVTASSRQSHRCARCAGAEDAKALIDKLGDSVGVYKIGLELLFSGGFALIHELAQAGRSVFVDAKLLDIEATVERRHRSHRAKRRRIPHRARDGPENDRGCRARPR